MSSSAVFPPRRGTRLGVRREEGAAGGLCGFEGGVILQSCTFRVKFWTLQRALVELRESERASEREKVSPWPQRHHLLALCPAVGLGQPTLPDVLSDCDCRKISGYSTPIPARVAGPARRPEAPLWGK